MRLFAGIAFDGPTRESFAQALERARPHADHAKWTRVDKAHLTLVFIGDGDPQALGDVVRGAAGRHRAFSLRLSGAGAFGRRVLWLGAQGDLEPLQALQADLAQTLARPDEHPYSPHVTLARAKRPRSFGAAVHALEGFASPPFRVEAVTLFESIDGSYRSLVDAPLIR
jgi:2'-5' RNA ligase